MNTKLLRNLLQSVEARWQLRAELPEDLPVRPDHALGYDPGTEEIALVEREALALANFNAMAMSLEAQPADVPGRVDWRNMNGDNYVTKVKNQGSCGSCVAFSTIAAVEATARVEQQDPDLRTDLSEAELFYCQAFSQGRTCQNGWYISAGMRAIRDQGVVGESLAPYSPDQQVCPVIQNRPTKISKITSFTQLNTIPQMMEWIRTRGPVVTGFTVYEDFYTFWNGAQAGGVYEHHSGANLGGHAVAVVGYDSEARYWICKNSWGTAGGDDGFFRIAFGECGVDAAMWGASGVVLGTPAAAVPPL